MTKVSLSEKSAGPMCKVPNSTTLRGPYGTERVGKVVV